MLILMVGEGREADTLNRKQTVGRWEQRTILERREQGPASQGDPKESVTISKLNLVFFLSPIN